VESTHECKERNQEISHFLVYLYLSSMLVSFVCAGASAFWGGLNPVEYDLDGLLRPTNTQAERVR
jgi:hypothetical protein